ncbi:hypothetical protein [Sphingomonas baiyangensis]|uniref:Uncharacterized protein n=1 Tax=Sphingomonas baiyangensis TaxID=2572576 RepID=A0A4U1L9R0_9SPHN|nr:hypothetical protein [Sphingomonas baiyangensis]TKD53185.1 hypothetical protein FBR43_02320 [Sphingomonas baiyangensis]
MRAHPYRRLLDRVTRSGRGEARLWLLLPVIAGFAGWIAIKALGGALAPAHAPLFARAGDIVLVGLPASWGLYLAWRGLIGLTLGLAALRRHLRGARIGASWASGWRSAGNTLARLARRG